MNDTVETSRVFLDSLGASGYDWFGGVPCSLLKSVIRQLEADPGYGWFPAVREVTTCVDERRIPAALLVRKGILS